MLQDEGSLSNGERAAGECFSLTMRRNVVMEFVWCPPGKFIMGSPESEVGRCWGEHLHEVTLSHGFWIARYPTTQLQYKAIVHRNPSKFRDDARPVEMVSWYTAVAFCEKVNERLGASLPEGFHCALPTQAQWEYACRAGTTSALNSGRETTSKVDRCPNLDAVAWYTYNSGNETHVVGQKPANAWGLFDMHGNVWEWCTDWNSAQPTESVTDPMGDEYGCIRVYRGGSWYSFPFGCRSACDGGREPRKRGSDCGFRPVLTVR